jgi:hypothetical protein
VEGLHDILAWALVAANGAVAALGIAIPGGAASSRWFRQLLALSQTLVAATGLLGLLLLVDGGGPDDPLHTRVYGPFMAVAIVAAWGFAGDDPRRNARIFGFAALAVTALGARAIVTA